MAISQSFWKHNGQTTVFLFLIGRFLNRLYSNKNFFARQSSNSFHLDEEAGGQNV